MIRSLARILGVLILGQALIAGVAAEESKARLSRLQGNAAIDRRNKVVGATVLVRSQADDSRLYLTSSGERGSFQVDDLPDGLYSVAVTRAGLQPVDKRDVTLRYPYRSIVEITMQAGAAPLAVATPPAGAGTHDIALSGSALMLDGEPIADAQVRLIRGDGSLDPRTARSAGDGSFAIDDLAAGEWRVEIRAVGLLPIFQSLRLTDDTVLAVGMVKQPADYTPTPLELMPAEQAIPPDALR